MNTFTATHQKVWLQLREGMMNDKTHKLWDIHQAPMFDASKKVTRFEVIDHTEGRLLVKYGVEVELSYQDDGRTLKVFLMENE
jgi:hypothetical protein